MTLSLSLLRSLPSTCLSSSSTWRQYQNVLLNLTLHSVKRPVIPLPVLPLYEQFDKGTVKILDYYEGLLTELPFPTKDPIQIGGDQLTRERFGTALSLRLGNLHNQFAQLVRRLLSFIPLVLTF